MIRHILISLLTGASLLSADTLVLRNGTRVDGTFVGGDNHIVRFAVGSQVNTYPLNDIDSIRFTSSPDNASNSQQPYASRPSYPPGQPNPQAQQYPQGAPYPQGQQYPQNASANTGYGPAPQQSHAPDTYSAPASAPTGNGPAGIEVPAGTQIVVRLIDGVDSEQDRLGQTFRASVDQPVVVNGQTVIPRGSDCIATLIDAQKSGKIEGRTVLTLDLKTVTVNGRTYDIVTTGVPQASSSRGQRSAKVIGGTAALGAIIGGIAGGGKGAAIGAGSGAAVGTAAEVATSGQRVKIPSETRLTFTLQNPIDL